MRGQLMVVQSCEGVNNSNKMRSGQHGVHGYSQQ